jgi:hypothetical protein
MAVVRSLLVPIAILGVACSSSDDSSVTIAPDATPIDSSAPEDGGEDSAVPPQEAAAETHTDAGADTPADVDAKTDAGCFVYSDMFCAGGMTTCKDVGDGKCYARCSSTADCTDPERSVCTKMYLFQGGDACVAKPMIRVCMKSEMTMCGPTT